MNSYEAKSAKKFTDDQIEEIVGSVLSFEMTYREVADKFGTTALRINSLVHLYVASPVS
jgi:hypothetical protein